MAGETVTISANSPFPNFLSLPVRTIIAGITVQTALEQVHTDTLEVTRHPVQAGAAISDHSYRNPSRLVLRCGWSNSDLEAAKQIVQGAVNTISSAGSLPAGISKLFSGGSMSAQSYIQGIYSNLLALFDQRQPFDVTTIKRFYPNMLMTSLSVQTDRTTAQALMVEATLEQIIIVNTSTSTLPSQDNQATPESTAEVVSTGNKSLLPGVPSPGGVLSFTAWGN